MAAPARAASNGAAALPDGHPLVRQHRFWEAYVAVDPDTAGDQRRGRGGQANRWRRVPGSALLVSRYCAVGGHDRVGLFLRGDSGMRADAWHRLSSARAAMEAALDAPLGERDFPFIKHRRSDLDDPADRAAAIDWLRAETARYEAAIRGCPELNLF